MSCRRSRPLPFQASTADAGGETPETIYDHPRYYDILFGWDRGKEAAFYDSVLAGRGVGRDEPILEVACGTGRVALLLAERGWNVTGLDLRPAMLDLLLMST